MNLVYIFFFKLYFLGYIVRILVIELIFFLIVLIYAYFLYNFLFYLFNNNICILLGIIEEKFIVFSFTRIRKTYFF